jgi:hypothetical protein
MVWGKEGQPEGVRRWKPLLGVYSGCRLKRLFHADDCSGLVKINGTSRYDNRYSDTDGNGKLTLS